MAVRPIRIIGDPVLHTPTRPVETFDDELKALVEDMFETMAAAEGVGLAANQVGVPLRLFVYDCPDEERGERVRGVVVNPVLETSERPETMPDPDDDEEGCLSVPAEHFPTGRADWARVTGVDADGRAGGRGGPRVPGPLPAARGRPPGRRDLHRPAGRAQPAGRAARRSSATAGAVPGLAWDPAAQAAEEV